MFRKEKMITTVYDFHFFSFFDHKLCFGLRVFVRLRFLWLFRLNLVETVELLQVEGQEMREFPISCIRFNDCALHLKLGKWKRKRCKLK